MKGELNHHKNIPASLYLQLPFCVAILKGYDYIHEKANDCYLAFFKEREILGKSLKSLLNQVGNSHLIKKLDHVYNTGEALSNYRFSSRVDKLLKNYNISCIATKNYKGVSTGLIVMINEYIESAIINDRENFYEVLLQSSSDSIVHIDSNLQIINVNSQLCELLKYSNAEILKSSINELLEDEKIFDSTLSQNSFSRNIILKIKRRDGIYINAVTTIEKLNNGGFIFLIKKVFSENNILNDAIDAKRLHFVNSERAYRAEELFQANKELAFQNIEKENRAAELIIANKELAFQNVEKENRAAELVIANKELAFQNDEKENRAAELIIANKELAFQNDEKENRAAELIIANKELAFQNDEKENRAAELVIANKELAFQNDEKENRAAELIIANKELAFQNDEKENRAAELVIANKELAFQNDEKENRAAELFIANKELAFQNDEKENRAAELVATNDELIKANAELDRFVYSVSHDLRSPLTSVLGLLSIIEDETQEADTLEHALMIKTSINRLDDFIKNILNYSRNNRTEILIEEINTLQIITSIVRSTENSKQAKGIHFEIKNAIATNFHSDTLRFTTILENIISNAVKYHNPAALKRFIKLSVSCNDAELVLTIEDNGVGIASEFHEKIFEMFFRLPGEAEGSGIGLYIVKETVEKLHGSIQITSKLGQGTTFLIRLKNFKYE